MSGEDVVLFVSMLPAGADEDLVMSSKVVTQPSELQSLVDQSVLVRVEQPSSSSDSKPFVSFRLSPTTTLPSQQPQPKMSLWHERMCSHFATKCEGIRRVWLSGGHADANSWLSKNEENIWACINFAATQDSSCIPSTPCTSEFGPYPESLGSLVYSFSTILRMTERRQEALRAIHSVLQTSLTFSCLRSEALCRLCLSKSFAETQSLPQSLDELIQSMALFSRVNEVNRYADSLLMLARMYSLFRCSPDDSVSIWKTHESKSSSTTQSNRPPNADIFSTSSPAFADLSLTPEQLLQKGMKLCQRTNDIVLQADMYLALGRVVLDAHGPTDKDRALCIFSDAMKLFEQAGDLFGQAESLKSLALMEWPADENNMNKRAMVDENVANSKGRRRSVSQDNGEDYVLKHRLVVYQRIYRHLENALSLYSQCNVPVSRANTLRMLAALEFEVAQCHPVDSPLGTAALGRAFDYATQAKNLFESLSRSHGAAACFKLIAEMHDYQAHNHCPESPMHKANPVQLLEKALDGFGDKTPQAQRMRIRTCVLIANILSRTGNNREEAGKKIAQAEKLCTYLTHNEQVEFRALIDHSKQQLVSVGSRM